jgi:hypothetical protein
MFPNILDFLSTDPATPWLHYAIVLNGKLQATNNKMACYIDVSTFLEDEAQIKAIEGKVFKGSCINALMSSNCNFSENSYNLGNKAEIEYRGTIGQNREIRLYDDLMDEYVLAKDFKKFPDFTTLIPALDGDDIEVAKVQKRNTHFRGVGVGVPQMVSISNAFQQSKDDLFNLRFEFFHADKTKDKVNLVSAPILVTPFKSKFTLYKEAAIINPVFKNE